MNNVIESDLRRQNPWWVSSDPGPFILHNRRNLFSTLRERVLKRDLITSLVGLRRTGKSTLFFQLIWDMLRSGMDPKRILYVSFEELPGKDLGDTLRMIIEYHLARNPDQKSYAFFDEIQYVNGWNSVLKHYFDLYPRLKCVVSGSASLFIRTKARESLAGRMQELVLHPMGYGEYLMLNNKQHSVEQFNTYLAWGEFPYLEKLPGWAEKQEYVNEFIIRKVVENDLPRVKKVYGHELLVLLNSVLLKPGQQIEIHRLATDLGIAQNTLREYLTLLEKTHLVSQVYNLGIGFRTRSVRQRKVYPSSVNAVVLKTFSGLDSDLWNREAGLIIELFVHNYLVREGGERYFWRQRQSKEVDFIHDKGEERLPVEVKYQNSIHASDLKSLLYYCKKARLKRAMVVTKNEEKTIVIDDVELVFTPAHVLL